VVFSRATTEGGKKKGESDLTWSSNGTGERDRTNSFTPKKKAGPVAKKTKLEGHVAGRERLMKGRRPESMPLRGRQIANPQER